MSETSSATTLQRTPFYPRLSQLKCKWVNFAGWEMPVEFSGIFAEHRAVRTNAGVFDLSHMGELELRPPEAALQHVQRLVTNDVSRLEVGGAQYTAVCRPDGNILDDILVYRAADRIMLVVNASNKQKMLEHFKSHAPSGIEVRDRTDELALLAVQGPKAEAILAPLADKPLAEIKYYHFVDGAIGGQPCIISRTGYTGEDGFELYVAADRALAVYDAVIAAGEPHGMVPIGLGARDTLRLEARYALYGNDIDETTNPYEAGMGWVVKLQKGDFIGREALQRVKESGPRRTLVGMQMEDRGVPRHGFELQRAGREIGVVTSGTYSPTLEHAIALGYVERTPEKLYEVGQELDVIVRKSPCKARVVKTPFYKGSVKS